MDLVVNNTTPPGTERTFLSPPDATTLSTLYAADVYAALGFGPIYERDAATIGKAILHTAMNACLKHSKGGVPDGI